MKQLVNIAYSVSNCFKRTNFYYKVGMGNAISSYQHRMIKLTGGAKMRQHKMDTTQNRQTGINSNLQNKNMISLAIFLMISIFAFIYKDFNLFIMAGEPLRQILGYPPPAYLINIALAVYCFSAATLTLTAIANNVEPEQKLNHLGYRVTFYFFYSFSGAISDNFVAIVSVGIALYALDQCHILIHNLRTMHPDGSILGKS